jgi:uncharacterized protein (TIGR00369 family)
MNLVPKDRNFEQRVRASFGSQRVMATLGASLESVEPGQVTIALPFREDLTQQHGFLHAGVVATIGDSACGYAAFSLMPADAGVLTIEFKINLLAPARGERFRAIGRVIRPGRTITVTVADVLAGDQLVATLTATIMTILDRPDVRA